MARKARRIVVGASELLATRSGNWCMRFKERGRTMKTQCHHERAERI